jgi:hypothetical protein
MEAVAEKNGVKIIAPKAELGVAKGVSYTLTKEVALNPRNSELQNVKTLLHELAVRPQGLIKDIRVSKR